MGKKPPSPSLRQAANTLREEERVHVKDGYFRHVDQIERWRQEYEHQQAVENNLAELSKIRYEQFDYDSLLVRVPWEERPIRDYKYLLEEARLAAEKKFFYPLSMRIGGLLFLIITLFVASNLIVLWIAGTVGIAVLVSLYVLSKERDQTIGRILLETLVVIEQKVEAERRLNEEARRKHEEEEDKRITAIECLLAGEVSAIFSRLDVVLPRLDLSFLLDIDITIYNQVPLVQIWLPPKSIIPGQLCAVTPSGRVSYQDKEARSVNKQYLELCAAVVMQIMATIYANIPTIDRSYVQAMSKDGVHDDCVIAINLDRQTLVTACDAANGLAAIQQTKAQFEVNTVLKLQPIEVERPVEWGEVEQQFLRSLHIKLVPFGSV
jgi:hypothetical protein